MRVRDVFSLSGLKYAYIKAGIDGLDNTISSVTVLEVAETREQNWLIEGQLYITSLYAVMNNLEQQLEIFEALIEAKSAGVIICHLDLWLKNIDPRIEELCNKMNFPLIIAKSETTYIEIMNPIILKLMEKTSSGYLDVNHMQNKLIEYVVSKKDVTVIYKTMTDFYRNGKLWFLDIDNKLIYPKYDTEFSSLVTHLFDSRKESQTIDDKRILTVNDKEYIIKFVRSQGIFFGTIIAEIPDNNLEDPHSILDILSRIYKLISTKSSRVSEIEIQRKQEYIGDLITWNFRSDEVAIKIGKDLNWNIQKISQIIVLNINKFQENPSQNLRELERFIENFQFQKTKAILKRENTDNLIGLRSDFIIILLAKQTTEKGDRINRLCTQLLESWDNDLAGNISIGVSNEFSDFRAIPKAYTEAIDAYKFGRKYFGENQYTLFRDLGCFGLLRDFRENQKLTASLENIFQKLKEYDEKNKQDLYNTLSQLISNNMDVDKVADSMFIHKNTVHYRKNKIIDLLGFEPWKMPYLLNTLMVFALEK
ncbi:PucR family transcriptional regulator ligand-binding domain-containing protein [Neobacillus niacini]|uniref:PucR family transcriptional regulator n=1 Tax=Neobacillus niacini TaxID=86668 RepID=UPI003000C1A5